VEKSNGEEERSRRREEGLYKKKYSRKGENVHDTLEVVGRGSRSYGKQRGKKKGGIEWQKA